MAKNIGYMTSDRTIKGNELYTPINAVKAILPHIPKRVNKIWCPFDTMESNYVRELSKNYDVVCTHIWNGQDFFDTEPTGYDCIISNPPFSRKFEILEKLFKLDKPFAILWPLPSIQIQKYFDLIKQCQLLIFDKRIRFHGQLDFSDEPGSPAFASIYLCKDFLEKDLIFARLDNI